LNEGKYMETGICTPCIIKESQGELLPTMPLPLDVKIYSESGNLPQYAKEGDSGVDVITRGISYWDDPTNVIKTPNCYLKFIWKYLLDMNVK
jgi:hypothetical protein